MPITAHNLKRVTLRKLQHSDKTGLVDLRLQYSEAHKLLTGYINKLVNVNRIYPRHLPTQASFRWSTLDPPITNWPRACINSNCVQDEHEWDSDKCWSVRDILLPDKGEVLITWDHDNIEGKIHDLIVNDQPAIKAHSDNLDLHTITCCAMFGYVLPIDLRNPHTSVVDQGWRHKYNWQGKDTKQRVLAKNFNHGSKYSKTWRFVYKIEGIEKYGVSRDHLGNLARQYITSKGQAWQMKLSIMAKIQRDRIARTLYGGRRVFFTSGEETGREGFSHMISGTVSDYNNHTLNLLEQQFGNSVRLLHNAHDGGKVAIKATSVPTALELKAVIERSIEHKNGSLLMSALVKIYN